MKQRKEEHMKDRKKKEKRQGNSRLRLGGVLAALVASVAIFAAMIQTEKNILTQYERGTIYTAVREIPRGQLITEDNYQQYFREQQLDKSCIPPTALNSPDQVTGLVAAYDIDSGILLTEGMFQELNDILNGMSEPVVAGFKAEDIYQVAGGVLRAGDRVNIYSVKDGETSLVWAKVFVQQVFDASGTAISNGDTVTAAQRINVYLDEAEVQNFYAELSGGSLRVVKLLE